MVLSPLARNRSLSPYWRQEVVTMTKKEITNLWCGVWAILRLISWLPLDPVATFQWLVLAVVVLLRDIVRIVVIPQNMRNQG